MSEGAPRPLVESRHSLSGLEFFQRMVAGELKPPPMVSLLGLRITEAEAGRVVFTGTAIEEFYNGLGVAHGGWAATLLDSALGCAINTLQPAGRMFTTLELKINYTRPITREAGEMRCEATVLYSGNRTATADARVVGRDGKLYAHATTTCIVVPDRQDRT
jgi:uncharacterized protein (TIGR00369 family)